ncbi:MAG TPA: hypothetical protein VF731_07310 [Solirubrobacterales bacterium]
MLGGWFDPSVVRGAAEPQGRFASVFRPCPSGCLVPFPILADDQEQAAAMERWFVPHVGRGPFPLDTYFRPQEELTFSQDHRPRRTATDFCGGYCLRGLSSRFSHFPWRVQSNWRPAVAPGVVPEAQWDLRLKANLFPYAGVAVWFSLTGHFPKGADPGEVGEELARLDPRYGRKACLTHEGRSLTPGQLLGEFGRRLVDGVLASPDFELEPSDCYSVTLLTKTDGEVDPRSDFGALAGLSRGVGDWASLAPDILDSYRETDYGLFRGDVCFVRRRGVLAHLPAYDHPDGSEARRDKRVLLWLIRPAELALLQAVIARSYREDFLTLGARVTRARLDTKEKVRNFFRMSFLQVDPLLFLRDLAAFQDELPPGARKLYRKIAAASGAERDLAELRETVGDVVQESEKWHAPVLSAMGPALSIGRKFGGL